MKKFLFLTLTSAILSTTIYAQTGSGPAAAVQQQPKEIDQAAMLQQMKDKFKQPMVAKTGLTEAQADRVIELNFEMRMAASALRDLSETERSAKIAELKTAKEKKMNELLTAEQIQSVKSFYEEMGKKMPPKG